MKYSSILRRFTLLISVLLLISFNTIAANNSKFLSLSEVRPGMKGVAYTVISGDKVESFNVKVIAVLAGSGSVKHLILVHVSGRALEGFGGIAAGMSGSPVYIQGKLVGAIGYGFQNADPLRLQ
ncbi:MAG TPA: SpoIVB peptidase S55 domain-containing protein [Bacillota bacterium]|nr:SpoIVB peptidase S55 domain-containing protein [Bacillota bacterium]